MSDDVKQPESFAFTAENKKKAEAIIAKYPEGRKSACMPLLELAQRQEGWVSKAAMEEVARMIDLPSVRVLEVATFYTMYNRQPVGKHHVQVCTNIACLLRGSDDVMRAAEEVFGLHAGDTAKDGSATLAEVECLGACVNAPMVQINDDYYEDLDYASAKALFEEIKAGKTPTPGSKIGRTSSEPAGGLTTLTEVKGA